MPDPLSSAASDAPTAGPTPGDSPEQAASVDARDAFFAEASTEASGPTASSPGGAHIVVLGALMRAAGIALTVLAVVGGAVMLISAPPMYAESPAFVPVMAALFAIRSAVHGHTGHRLMLGGRHAIDALATYRIAAVGQTALVLIVDTLVREPALLESVGLAAILLAWPLLVTLLVGRAIAAGPDASRTDRGLSILGAVIWFAAALGVFACVVALGVAALGGGMGFGWYAVAVLAGAIILAARFRQGLAVGGLAVDGAHPTTYTAALATYRTVSWMTLAAFGAVVALTLALTAGWAGLGWWVLGACVAVALQGWVASLGAHAQRHLVDPPAWAAAPRNRFDLAGVGAVLAALGLLSTVGDLDDYIALARMFTVARGDQFLLLVGVLLDNLLDGPLLLVAGWRLWTGTGRRLAWLYGAVGAGMAAWGLIDTLGELYDMPAGMPAPGVEFVVMAVLAGAAAAALPVTVVAVLWRDGNRA